MIPEAQKQQMAEAVAKIRETMAAAAKAAGRDPAEVRPLRRLQDPHGGGGALQRRPAH